MARNLLVLTALLMCTLTAALDFDASMEVSSLGLDSSVLNNLVSDLGEEPDSQTGTEVRKNIAAAEAKLGNTISGMKKVNWPQLL